MTEPPLARPPDGQEPSAASALIPAEPKVKVGPGLVAWTWLWTGLGLLLAVALPLWPYKNSCGFPLTAYLAIAGMTLLVGLWAAVTSWRYRRGLAHLLSLLTIAWSATIVAGELLPRIGYAKVERIWLCP